VNILKVLLCSNAGNKTPASLVNGVVNNSVFHSNSHISQMLHHIIHILHFCLVDSLLNHAPDFVISWTEVTNLEAHRGDHGLWDYHTSRVEAANDARQTVWVNTTCGKDYSQKNLSKLMLHI